MDPVQGSSQDAPAASSRAQDEFASSEGRRLQIVKMLLSLRQKLADWEITPQELRLSDNSIGFGSTSIVYLGHLHGVPGEVAVKEVSFATVEEAYGEQDAGTILAITRELEVWPQVNHPNILKFLGFGFSEDATKLRICSQYCRGGTLFDLLHNCWDIELNTRQKRKILLDVAGAVDYLHNISTPVMHRDLKSLNILLLDRVVDEKSEIKVKLADFGFARIKPTTSGWSDLTSGAGTPHWMAPEVMTGSTYHLKADVFSFAVIMYEVVSRHMAFETLDAEQVQDRIAQGERPALYGETEEETYVPPTTPTVLRELIARCWSQGPLDRPSMDEVIREVKDLDWPDV